MSKIALSKNGHCIGYTRWFNIKLHSIVWVIFSVEVFILFLKRSCVALSLWYLYIFENITLIFFHRLQEDPPTGVSGAPTDNNILIWNAVIFGPHDTPFEDGTFKLTIEFTEEYPNKPPTVRFVSKMFHPNVYADGGICLDILQNRWSPTYDVSAILTSIQVSKLVFFSVTNIVWT